MNAMTSQIAIKTITKHYIDGAFVESHGCEVMDIINPTNECVRLSIGWRHQQRQRVMNGLERCREAAGVFSIDLKVDIAVQFDPIGTNRVDPRHRLHAFESHGEHVSEITQRIRSLEEHHFEIFVEE